MNATLRDTARFGLMMEQGGIIDGRRIAPAAFVYDIQENAFKTRFPGVSYRSQWWVHPNEGDFAASGVSGQRIMIYPDLDLVIVKFSSWPALSGYSPKGGAYDQRAVRAIADYVKKL